MDQIEFKKMDELQQWHWWYRGRRSVVKGLFRKYMGAGPYLDVGCGTGEGSFVVPTPSELTGIDESAEALVLAKSKGYKELHQGQADILPFSESSFGGVMALDVVEHVDDDCKMLRECFRVLKPGGTLLLTVPAYEWLWSEHDERFGHKRRYLKRDLVRKVREAGFEVLFASYFFTLLFPIVAFVRIYKKAVHSTGSDFFALPIFFNAFFYTLLIFEATALRLGIPLLFGSSIIFIAHKRPVKSQ